jgi:hypothetical protein
MAKSLPPIGKVMNWLEAAGFEVSYLYEDLIFVESNAFLIRFEPTESQSISIYTNFECDASKALELGQLLIGEAQKHELMPVLKGVFTLSQRNDDEIDIKFEQ